MERLDILLLNIDLVADNPRARPVTPTYHGDERACVKYYINSKQLELRPPRRRRASRLARARSARPAVGSGTITIDDSGARSLWNTFRSIGLMPPVEPVWLYCQMSQSPNWPDVVGAPVWGSWPLRLTIQASRLETR